MRSSFAATTMLLVLACGGGGDAASPRFDPVADEPDAAPVGDASLDAGIDGPKEGGASAGCAALAAASSSAVWATTGDGTTWSTPTAIGVGAITGAPAIAPHMGGFVVAASDPSGSLVASAWSAGFPSLTPVSQRSSDRAPSLAAVSGRVHVVYRAPDAHFFHGIFDGAWDGADDTIGGGVLQSQGADAPTATALGAALVVAQIENDGLLYDQSWTEAGGWSLANAHSDAPADETIAPRIVALSGGDDDLAIVFARVGDHALMFTTRAAASSTWTTPSLVVDPNVRSDARVAMIPLANGGALLAFRGTDGAGYVSTYTPKSTPAWSAPEAFGASLASAPALAAGASCGADPLIAYALSAGSVHVAKKSGGAWTSTVVAGLDAATTVALATR